ncbi:MAG TPA: glycerophosphodiester phosphodiesterase [Acidimicrobiales bacterium]
MARHPRLLDIPIGFAHRGASAAAPENTLEAFRLAVELGASGLESDVWVSTDGEPVLDHDGVVGGWLRRRPMNTVRRRRLPDHIPTLGELYEACGTDLPLSLDVKDPAALDAVLASADAVGARGNLWLCHPDIDLLAGWRDKAEGAHLVASTRLRAFTEGTERAAAELSRLSIDAVNLHHTEWTGGLTTLFHRFELVCLGWDAQLPRHLAELLDMGIDGVFSDHVDRMMEAIEVELGSSP